MKKIFKTIPKIILTVLFVVMGLITLVMAYIMFAPDAWPKPFYLVYPSVTGPQAPAEKTNTAGTQTPAEAHTLPVDTAPTVPLQIRPGQGLMYDTGTKIVNLLDPTGRKYLRVGIVLEYAPVDLRFYTMAVEEKATFTTAFNDEVKSKLPIMNDVIITLLSSQTYDSVYTAEGKEKLRKSLMDTLNSQLPEYHVIFVYFTEFVVQ